MACPSVLFSKNISFQIMSCLFGEMFALNIIKEIRNADDSFHEFQKKSVNDYAHFLIAHCAYETNNPQWLEDLTDNEIRRAAGTAYYYVYSNSING